jgi:hypothetical protein
MDASALRDAEAPVEDTGVPLPDAATRDAGVEPDGALPPPCPADVTYVSTFIFSEDRDTSRSTRQFHVNMYWTSAARPARGTRMIIQVPGTTRAVVVAAGYETGPGDLAKIGGTPEESHFFLGPNTTQWTLGIAKDQTLPLGPRECTR